MGNPVLDAIEQLRTLPPGWDSYGAPPIEHAAVERAKWCVDEIQWRLAPHYSPPTVGPDVDGGVELIWRSPSGTVHLLIGAGESYKIIVMRGEHLSAPPIRTKQLGDLIGLLKTHLQR